MAYSEYFNSLASDIKTRYLEKICVISGVDPYSLNLRELSLEVKDLPKITHGDIVYYLVFQISFYTLDEFKAFKSLNSYNQFLCGWVKQIATKQIAGLCVVVAKVLHSQRLNLTPLYTWIIAKLDGQIISAHCNCVAGLGETCSHVGALLFAIDDNVRNIETTSVTGVKAYWKVPSTHAGAQSTSRNIDYTSSSKLLKVAKGEAEVCMRSEAVDKSIPIASADDLVKSLQTLKDNGFDSALFSAVKPFCDDIVPPLSNVLGDIYKEEHEKKELASLISIGQQINILFTDEQCKDIEVITRKQSKCAAWYKFRLGRITASNFKACVKTKIENPSISLVNKICYPTKQYFRNAATEYGCMHEEDGVIAFAAYMENHANLKITDAGLIINPKFPEASASPDSLVDCSCCEPACLEVKCPFCARDLSIEEATLLKNFCLKKDKQYFLPQTHPYFYQCQMQMAVTERRCCYFVVWTKNEIYVENIKFNEEFWKINYQQSRLFFRNVIVPELLSKYYSRRKRRLQQEAADAAEKFCLCQMPEAGRPMIACDSENCSIEWYHMSCVELAAESVPEKWICTLCS